MLRSDRARVAGCSGAEYNGGLRGAPVRARNAGNWAWKGIVVDILSFYRTKKPVVSFELFPPKTWQGMASLFEHFKELMTCNPSYITCTYGAGGDAKERTRQRTLEVLDLIRREYPEIPVLSHLTCVNMGVEDLRAYIARAVEIGVSGIVALRGDPPAGQQPYVPVDGGLRYANELVSLLRAEYPALSVVVAGYPAKHPEAVSMEADLENLKRKVDAGADVVVTQLFYDNALYYRFRDQCAAAGIETPIVPGILPVTNLSQARRITSLCGAHLTDKLVQRLEKHGEDEEGQFSVGVYYAARQIEELVEQGAPGIHFYVMNKSRAAALICRALTL